VPLKAFLAAAAVAAIVVGFALPAPHGGHAAAHARSQIATIDLAH
jgi:hypothetical protein